MTKKNAHLSDSWGLKPKEEELFEALRTEPDGMLTEDEVIAILWLVWPDSEEERGLYKKRLKSLQSGLNRQLRKMNLPYHVIRPQDGKLELYDPNRPPPKMIEWAELLREFPSLRDFLPPEEWTVERCAAELRNELSSNPVESTALRDEFAYRGCPRKTYDSALKQIGARRFRQGFGASGKWLIALL